MTLPTLQNLKDYLKVETTAEDTALTAMLSRATGIVEQAVPTISAAWGSVASLGVGAILAASSPPTRIIIDPADMTSDWHRARIQTLRGRR